MITWTLNPRSRVKLPGSSPFLFKNRNFYLNHRKVLHERKEKILQKKDGAFAPAGQDEAVAVKDGAFAWNQDY